MHDLAVQETVLTIPRTARKLGIREPTVAMALTHLTGLTILTEITGRQRRKVYLYREDRHGRTP